MDVSPAGEPTVPLAARPVEPAPTGSGTGLISLLGAVAGLLIVAGGFMAWAGLSIDGAAGVPAKARSVLGGSVLGFRIPDARIVLGLGAALLILSLLAWAARGGALLLHAAVLALATAGVGLSVSLGYLTAQTRGTVATELARQVAAGSVRAGARLSQIAERVHVTKGLGLWLTLAGALLALIAATIELLAWSRAEDRAAPGARTVAYPPEPGASQ